MTGLHRFSLFLHILFLLLDTYSCLLKAAASVGITAKLHFVAIMIMAEMASADDVKFIKNVAKPK
jgi:hypothetical protein